MEKIEIEDFDIPEQVTIYFHIFEKFIINQIDNIIIAMNLEVRTEI